MAAKIKKFAEAISHNQPLGMLVHGWGIGERLHWF